jgi:5'-3' exonuclease
MGSTIKYLRGAAGIGLGTRIKYLRRSTSGAAGSGMCTTIKYVRGAAGIGMGTTIKYLRRTTSAAANNGLGTTIKYLVNQNADAGSNWAKATQKLARIQMNSPVV